ncbi:Retrovirus-related Pol polyprotein from transposon RE2 [Linum perenne]
MVQPPGFIDATRPDHVCRLHKSLYGLKQAPRAWFACLRDALLHLEFTGSKTDHSLFYRTHPSPVYVLVYVDDIIITGASVDDVRGIITSLATRFQLKDLGRLSYFLGVEVHRTDSTLHLSQGKYIADLLHKAGLQTSNPVATPYYTPKHAHAQDELFDRPTDFRQLLDGLQYLQITRPDISYAVNRLSQTMHSPSVSDWTQLKRVLRYLKGTPTHGITLYRHSSHHLSVFTDADWAGDTVDRRSTSAYVTYLGPNIISWSSRKQRTVSRSSTEAEYRALATASSEILWLTSLLHEIGFPTQQPPTVWCDNIGATYLSRNPVFHSRSKHLEIDFHFVRERVASKHLHVAYISTKDQIADALTKPLPAPRFSYLRLKLNVAPAIGLREGDKG